jgi:predicted restriction endonuclease
VLWNAFHANPEGIAAEAEAAHTRLTGREAPPMETELNFPEGPTEISRMVRTRRVQAFFRDAVLVSYQNRCALSDIALPELLNASHIIPWTADTRRRADPHNGIALNALYDRAFDRGLITFDESFRTVLSARVRGAHASPLHRQALLELEGRKLRFPTRFAPDPVAMAYHREHVFIGRG